MHHYESEIPQPNSTVVAALKAAVAEALANVLPTMNGQHSEADAEAEKEAAEIIASIPDKIKAYVDGRFIQEGYFYSVKLVDDWQCKWQGRPQYVTRKVSAIVLAHCRSANVPYFFCSHLDDYRGQGNELRVEIVFPGRYPSRARDYKHT